jgi:hypothetical protein
MRKTADKQWGETLRCVSEYIDTHRRLPPSDGELSVWITEQMDTGYNIAEQRWQYYADNDSDNEDMTTREHPTRMRSMDTWWEHVHHYRHYYLPSSSATWLKTCDWLKDYIDDTNRLPLGTADETQTMVALEIADKWPLEHRIRLARWLRVQCSTQDGAPQQSTMCEEAWATLMHQHASLFK